MKSVNSWMLNHLSSEATYLMPQKRFVGQVLVSIRRENRPRSRPGTRWSDNTSDLDWPCLGVKPAELFDVSVGRAVFRVLLGLLSLSRLSRGKAGTKWIQCFGQQILSLFCLDLPSRGYQAGGVATTKKATEFGLGWTLLDPWQYN